MAGFVVIEGIDGCGKSTVARALARRLGDRAVLTREPTDSWIGKAVRKGEEGDVSPYLEALLFMADRAQHTVEIAELVRQGKLVICDRYYHSTVAYQTAYLKQRSLGDQFDWLLDANTRISVRPDMTFILFLEPERALGRVEGRGGRSRFEQLELLKEVHRNYVRLADADDSIVRVDAEEPPEKVAEGIMRLISERKL